MQLTAEEFIANEGRLSGEQPEWACGPGGRIVNRLQAWINMLIAYWLRPVVELPEPERPNWLVARSAHAAGQFRVVTPEVQRLIDQSA